MMGRNFLLKKSINAFLAFESDNHGKLVGVESFSEVKQTIS